MAHSPPTPGVHHENGACLGGGARLWSHVFSKCVRRLEPVGFGGRGDYGELMNNDNEMIWPLVAIVGLYIFYKISLTNAAVTSQQIASQTATANDPCTTMPAG